tara:strand:+ start:57595 stop:58794 length:1200 start_codon:yes stop_codon:yes gene_type:complete
MRSWAIISLLVVTSSFAGCMGDEDRFVWPEPESWGCSIQDGYNLSCYKYLDGFSSPISSIKHPALDEIWIVELSGKISSWDGSAINVIADLGSEISRCHFEQGLLGMAFDEDFINSRKILLSYVEIGDCDGPNESDLILATANIGDDGFLDLASIEVLMEIEQPHRNHNGGHLLNIGGDQFLWGIGDGGGSSDPEENGQNTQNRLGSILLFSFINGTISPVIDDPIGDPYVLHHGLRNPWRFDVDDQNRLWIADVGQNCWEEVNLVPIRESANFGWSEREGMHRFHDNGYTNEDGTCNLDEDESPVPEEMTDPVGVYPHEGGNCSITGGFWMDWGPDDIAGGYLYGDFCSGSMWVISEENDSWNEVYIGSSGGMIVGFGEGLGGELLVFHWTGEIVNIG